MMLQLRYFLVAVQFFTRIPITGRIAHWMGFEASWISRCTRFFPLIGLLLGILLAALFNTLLLVFNQSISIVITTVVGILITGAFHEDGFADFCDGFGGGQTPERIITIMRDSRVGAYGAIGIMLMLLTKIQALSSLDAVWVGAALVIGHSASRGFAVFIMIVLPYVESKITNKTNLVRDAKDDEVREDEVQVDAVKADRVKPVAAGLLLSDWLPALCFGFLPAILLGWAFDAWLPIGCGLLCATVVSIWMWWNLRRRLGGYTGDTLGATQQLAETIFYLGMLATV